MAAAHIRNQSLPNECLLHVLGFLRHDLFELHNVLTVNRFCYHAVLPWMMDNALERWRMNMYDCGWAVSREKLMVLYVVSVLQYSGPASRSLLELCDLELVDSPSPGYQLLAEYMSGRSRLTLDYSKFQTQFPLVYMSWNFIDLNSFVRLKTLPEEWEGTVPPPPMLLGPVDWEYKKQLQTALVLFFATHNPEPITVLTLHLSSLHKFIPLANRFTNLSMLRLPMGESLPDSQIRDLIAFLQNHQSAFPRKCRLALEFHDEHRIDYDMPPRERRLLLFARARPMLASFKTQEWPSTLDVSHIPRFYDHCDEISTSDLRCFVDKDEERYLVEGYAGQERFLERCDVLESMELVLHDARMFSWAVNRMSQESPPPLPNLRNLAFRLSGTVRQMSIALKDVALVWGRSLERIECSWQYESLSRHAIEQDQALANVPDSNKIGSWSLPALRTIVLGVKFNAAFEVGTFSGCPALETLVIHMDSSHSSWSNTSTTEPSQDQSHRIALPTAAEFAHWTLPNVRELKLTGYAALLFDYASLRSMRKLNRLSLITKKSIMKDVKGRLTARMELYLSQAFGNQDHVNNTPVDPQTLNWYDYTLPGLHHVHLEGLSAKIIPFEWLLRCPVLESLRVIWVGCQQHLLSRPELLNNETFNYQSQLDVLELDGSWTASVDDLVWILTHHANQLSRLCLVQAVTQKGNKLETAALFSSVRRADDINQEAFESSPSRWSRAPGSRLVDVHISLFTDAAKVKAMGLQIIDRNENVWKIRQRRKGLRIYTMGSLHAIVPE